MGLTLIGISMLCVGLIVYLLRMKLQLRSIKRQLEHREKEQAESPVLLEMMDRDLIGLTVVLNETLRQEAALRVSQERKEQEFKTLITNISHDLRTPLTAMKGYLQLLEKCELDETGREYMEICFRHTDELERRIRQFFEYSYWAGQEEDIVLHTVNVTNLVIDTMTDFIPVFEEKGISMKLEDDMVRKGLGDEELLKRVMQNILKNCLRYASGTVIVSITDEDAEQSGGGDRIKVCVTNPVDKNYDMEVGKVFQRFYVGNTERNQSTGLGLSIVKLLVEKMQGEVFAGMDDGVFYVGFTLQGP